MKGSMMHRVFLCALGPAAVVLAALAQTTTSPALAPASAGADTPADGAVGEQTKSLPQPTAPGTSEGFVRRQVGRDVNPDAAHARPLPQPTGVPAARLPAAPKP